MCRGNICRSPFAEAYARLRLDAVGLNAVQTSSAGSYPIERRQPPATARLVSCEFGIELSEYRSRVLASSVVQWAGAILCMDIKDHNGLREAFPEARGKLFYLGAFGSKEKSIPIADPWNKGIEAFRSCYRQVAASVDGLIESLKD